MPKGVYIRTHPVWNKGLKVDRDKYPTMGHFKPHTQETRDLISRLGKGRILSSDLRRKWSKTAKKHGFGKWMLGRTMPLDVVEKGAAKRRGSLSYNWKGGVTPESQKCRNSVEYKNWRASVFERDEYACKRCGDNKGGNLNAHHLLPFASYRNLRFIQSNGLTLCESCHTRIHQECFTPLECV